MNSKIKLAAALLALGFTAFTANAQYEDEPNTQKDENIVIHKKAGSNEKLTIVVDGDNVTVNGKPISEFKDDNIEVITDGGMPQMDKKMQQMPPLPPGGIQMFRENRPSTNKALLGVATEKADNGAQITSVTEGSPAEKAGLQTDDIITKVGDATINNPDDLFKAIGIYKPGDKVSISYIRNGAVNNTLAVLDKNKEQDLGLNRSYNYNYFTPPMHNFHYNYNWNNNKPHMGIEVQDTEDGNGVKITDVNDDDAPAAKAGLKEGDIITTINGTAVRSVADIKNTLKDAKGGDSFTVVYLRDGKTQTAQVKFPKELKSADL